MAPSSCSFVSAAPEATKCLTVDTQKKDGVHLKLERCNHSAYKSIPPHQRFQLAPNSFYNYYFLLYIGDRHATYPTAKQIGVTFRTPGYSFQPQGPLGNGSTISATRPTSWVRSTLRSR